MNDNQSPLSAVSDVTELPDIAPEFRNGVLMVLEDGDVDTTIRPSPLSLHVHPDTGPDVSADVQEFQSALEKYKDEQGRPLPTWSEVFQLLHHLGFRKDSSPAKLPQTADGPKRSATIQRETTETTINLALNLDGTGKAEIATGIGFFDHMLTLLAKHSLIDLQIEAKGDLHIDAHHTVEDVGICFGTALAQALGDKTGIRRYGSVTLPMDEVLVTSALDLSGRPFFSWQAEVPVELLGTFNASLAEEFWRAVANSAAMNLHIVCHHGRNSHHIIEGIFKATARALRQAVEMDPRMTGVPSTKGVL